ncbi:hypothetical protein ILYODFUR_014651 [Ilyodon furcidens]|uniref:Uncharacterized protein n=1 Tax=Ilyodon furcidens TaxID=33524 RepID=A0ABV0SL78_9TELE
MPDLVFKESSSTWMFLSLEKDFLATWIIPGLPTPCFISYWLATIPTVPFLEQLRTTTSEPCPPSHTITSSAEPQSTSKWVQVPTSSVHLSVQFHCCLTPSWRIKHHSLLSSSSSSTSLYLLTVK